MNNKILPDSKRKLIERYIDQELGFFGRLRVGSLLKNSKIAKQYMDSCLSLKENIKNCTGFEQQDKSDIDRIFSNIEKRIQAEERSAIFLGERITRSGYNYSEEKSLLDRFLPYFSGQKLGFSYGAGAAFACVAVILTVNGTSPFTTNQVATNSIGTQTSITQPSGVDFSEVNWSITANPTTTYNHNSSRQPIGVSSDRMMSLLPEFDSNYNKFNLRDGTTNLRDGTTNLRDGTMKLRDGTMLVGQSNGSTTNNKRSLSQYQLGSPAVEVDWMRSHGKVQIVNDPNLRAPILWIKKRNPTSVNNSYQAELAPSKPKSLDKNRPVIIEEGSNKQGIVLESRPIPLASYPD